MAGGSYLREPSRALLTEVKTTIPLRATRQLQTTGPREVSHTKSISENKISRTLSDFRQPMRTSSRSFLTLSTNKHVQLLLKPEHRQLRLWIICVISSLGFLSILLSAAINLRPRSPNVLGSRDLRSYAIQVGGDLAGSWQQDQPLASKLPIGSQIGPYSVLGQPSLGVDFINQVLAAYHSPAAGRGQALYDLGIQYGIDPAFALAFFMHESSFGTKGEAINSLSLGNLRCIPNFRCQDNFAWFRSWEDGFKAWYALIRNLYVAQWGLTTVDQIIPRYAPAADHNNEHAYIAAIKHEIDTWHAHVIFVSP